MENRMHRQPAHSGRSSQFFRPAVLVLSTFLLLITAFPVVHASDYASPGSYAAGWTRVTITRADLTTFTARLYYPARTRGQDMQYDRAGAPYPAIVFGHGYQINPTFYGSMLEHLASWGYFVCAPESGLELFPNHKRFAEDLSRCLTYLEQEDSRKGAWLADQVDAAHFGASGHSMGAGASILTAQADARIRAVANLSAAETNPSAVAAAPGVAVPVRLIVGSADGIVSPAQTASIFAAARAPRQLSVIQGGTHCGFLDTNAQFCDPAGMARLTQLSQTRRLLTGFFNLYLKSDQSAWRETWGPELLADPLVRTQADPGSNLGPVDREGSSAAKGKASYALTLTNTGPRAVSYSLSFESNRWPTTTAPLQTVVLKPNETAQVTVEVLEPAAAAEDESDVVIVSARNDADGGTRSYVRIETTAK
jgi:predicted dienelactone hydrolase